jgi:dTDP-4-dehydrorhamnose reductase
LLGLYDWHVLVTRIEGRYEPGVFDVRSPHPRPTAISGMLRDLAAGRTPHHPLLDVPGWWHRPGRFIFGFSVSTSGQTTPVDLPAFAFDHRKHPGIRPIAIVGSAGTLGQTFARACEQRGIPYCLLPRPAMDITNAEAVDLTLVRLRPWAVINVAGYSDVDGAEREPDLCRLINVTGAENVARACARHGAQLLSFSSDLVFGNNERTTYVESDAAAPRGAYGRSKLEAETRVASALPSALIVRTGPLFGGPAAQDFVSATRLTLAEGGVVLAPCDQMVSPTYVVDLAHACLDLLVDAESGIWHLANQGALTFAQLARQVAEQIGADPRQIRACASADLGLTAPRPPFRALGSERGALLPALDDALACYLAKPLTASVPQPVLEPQAAPILPP